MVEIKLFLDCLKNQYNKNETFILKKSQNSLKSKVSMAPKTAPSELLVMPSFDFLAKLEHQRLFEKVAFKRILGTFFQNFHQTSLDWVCS